MKYLLTILLFTSCSPVEIVKPVPLTPEINKEERCRRQAIMVCYEDSDTGQDVCQRYARKDCMDKK